MTRATARHILVDTKEECEDLKRQILAGGDFADLAKKLAEEKIDCAVLHVPTIKPLDVDTIAEASRKTGRLVVTAENHTIVGGLGEAVAGELMRRGVHPEFHQIACPDEFLDAGALPTLHDRYGLSEAAVIRQTQAWLGR